MNNQKVELLVTKYSNGFSIIRTDKDGINVLTTDKLEALLIIGKALHIKDVEIKDILDDNMFYVL